MTKSPAIEIDNKIGGLELTESDFPALLSLKHSREENLTDGVKKVVQSKELESFLELFAKELNNNPSLANQNVLAGLGFTLWNDRLKSASLVKLNMIRKNVVFPNSEMATFPTVFTLANYGKENLKYKRYSCLLYTSPSPRDATLSRMPSSA